MVRCPTLANISIAPRLAWAWRKQNSVISGADRGQGRAMSASNGRSTVDARLSPPLICFDPYCLLPGGVLKKFGSPHRSADRRIRPLGKQNGNQMKANSHAIDLRPLWLVGCLLVSLVASSTTFAKETESNGSRSNESDVNSQSDLHALNYMIGEWSVTTYVRSPEGTFEPVPESSMFRARYLRDGLSIMAEYFERRTDGFYGFHIINFDASRGFAHRYFDARRNQRIEFNGALDGTRYQITRQGGYNGKGAFLYREVDRDIGANSFVKRIYMSKDEGESWIEGDYYFRFERDAREGSPTTSDD